MSLSQVPFSQLQLFTLTDKFIIVPPEASEFLLIDRISNEITLSNDFSLIPAGSQSQTIFGIWGIIHLLSGPHLIVIKQRSIVGNLFGNDIWRVTESQVLPFARSTLHLTERMALDNSLYLHMVEQVLNTESFYFSYTHDLTHSLQRLSETSPDFRQMSLSERADERFVWNYHLLSDFRHQRELAPYSLPIMHGFIKIHSAVIGTKALDYALISRRSRFRAGVRLFMRGADNFGYVANFVETEQIVHGSGCRFSFVQTRGSIPLLWSQYPNLLYKPPPSLLPNQENQLSVFTAHFNDQIYTHHYGHQTIVNLIENAGKEKAICRELTRCVNAPSIAQRGDVDYEYFDFHHECSKMRWDRLSILLDRTEAHARRMSYFETGPDGGVVRIQRGVFRVNCMDCLDRTNVVQSIFARRVLLHQLHSLGCLSESADLPLEFDRAFKNIWADNADAVSKQYSGTGALKADFTRSGKRTKMGAFNDLTNSVSRYFRNNFSDGFRQDAVDLFLGNYIPESSAPSPFAEPRDWKTWFLPIIFIIGVAMIFFCLLLPPEHWSEQILFLLFWGTFVALSLFGFVHYGHEFVDRPRLIHLQYNRGSEKATLNGFKFQ